MRLAGVTSLLVLLGCGSAPPPSAPAPLPPPAPVVAESAAPPPPPPPALELALHREVDAPATALALEAPPHAAALGPTAVWIHDVRGWRSEPLPGKLLEGPPPRLSIFYGRDNRVRLVGTRSTERGLASIYLRSKPDGFVSGASELAKLADLKGGLVAVLGTRDPEILCRPGDTCFIKRRTGWTLLPAPAQIERVVLGDDVGWGLGGRTLYRLEATFGAVGEPGTWQRADHLFALRDRAFVVETEPGILHAFDGARWQTSPSPIPHPRAMWGSSAAALWLVGDGIAFFDGAAWHVAAEARGPFAAVAGRSADDVWIAGASGVFRVERRGSAK